jgi:hypothetical protein
MSTQDPTSSKRAQDLRLRHKRRGDKSYLLWLSPTTQARLAKLKREGETLAQLFDRPLEALEGVAKSVAQQQPDRQRLEVWVPDDLVDSLRAFLLGGVAQSVANQRETVAKPVAQQQEGVAKSVATPQLVAQAKELHKQGVSFRDIARRWNKKGIPTPSGKGQWHGASVARRVSTE